MPSQEDMQPFGRPHLLSNRNVAHSSKDGTAVIFFFSGLNYLICGSGLTYMRVISTAYAIHLIGLCLLITSGSVEPEKDQISALIKDLSSEAFQVREKASRQLWNLGDVALPALREAILSNDPEVSMRAKNALDKVELRITDKTSEKILSVIESYRKAPSRLKMTLLNELKDEKAYFQLLKLYSMENEEEQRELASVVQDVALVAAREAIMADDVKYAVEILNLAPANHTEMMALACLYRSLGQLDAQLAKVNPPKNVAPEIWRGYLFRAKGDLDSAIENAQQTNQPQILAGLKVLKGDPIPWLELNNVPGHTRDNPQQEQQAYVEIALKRWRGEEVVEKDFESLVKMMKSNNRMQRNYAMRSLASLGKFSMVQDVLNAENSMIAYIHHVSREEIDKALGALGLDPNKPDYSKWVKLKFDKLKQDGNSESIIMEIVMMASFMEKRGLEKELDEAFESQLADIKKIDIEVYWHIISTLFMGDIGAPTYGLKHVTKWAGEDEERWGEAFLSVLGSEEATMEWLAWIREIDPKMKDREALEVMLAIFKMNSRLGKLREDWMNRIWKVVKAEKDKDQRMGLVMRVMQLSISQQDAQNTIKAWDLLDEEHRITARWGSIDMYLTAVGRWEEAAQLLISLTEEKKHASPEIHAQMAATLRRGGMEEEAKIHDMMADKLCLGSAASSMRIGAYYVYGGDYERADVWFQRAMLEADPTHGEYLTALEMCAQKNVRNRNWKIASSCHEVIVHINASSVGSQYRDSSMGDIAKDRMSADLARAMSILPENKERALKTLKSIHQDFLPDGVLADDFFPVLREAGLHNELQTWFMESWNFIEGVIEKYPKSHNSRNTAAWFASRAGIKLKEAEKYLLEAIEMSPEQAAYLDTMAELKFAQGNRKAALEWSQRSVSFAPFEDMIRSQYERFRTAPLPKN
jgi:tetratricopeptide (TPR) repeat protein